MKTRLLNIFNARAAKTRGPEKHHSFRRSTVIALLSDLPLALATCTRSTAAPNPTADDSRAGELIGAAKRTLPARLPLTAFLCYNIQMDFRVIENPDFRKFKTKSGFKNSEFKRLAGLFSRAASFKALYDIGIDVDFDEGVCTFTYYKSNAYKPFLQFVVRHVGPQTSLYELYMEGKGRIARSGLFNRVFERLEQEIETLIPRQS